MEATRLFPARRTSEQLRRACLVRDVEHGYQDAVAYRASSNEPLPDYGKHEAVKRRPPVAPRLDNLVLSNPKRTDRSRVSRMAGSFLFHVAVVYAATVATMKDDSLVNTALADTSLVFLTSEPEPQSDQPEQEPDRPVIAAIAPPKGFQTLVAPIDVPLDIPPIDVGERYDPRDYSGVGVEGGVFGGVEGSTSPVDGSGVFESAVVDEAPERLGGPPLEYPAELRRLGVEGSVVVEFVVDTSGRVQEETIRVISSTHKEFEKSAHRALRASRFRSGRLRGQRVRVLVQQRLDFALVSRGV